MLKKIQLSTKFDTPHGPPQATQKAPTRRTARHKCQPSTSQVPTRHATSANPTRAARPAASNISGRSDSSRPPPQTFQGAAMRRYSGASSQHRAAPVRTLKKAPFPYMFSGKGAFIFFIILDLISITRSGSSHMTLGFSPLRLRRAA